MRFVTLLLLTSILVVRTQALADSSAVPNSLVRSGISLTNTCAGVHTQTLARRLALEIASARARKPGSKTEVALSCKDVHIVMTLHRPAPEPPLRRDFIWQGDARKQPERWLALAIHQSLLDAGVVEVVVEAVKDEAAVTSVAANAAQQPLPLSAWAANAELGWRAMGIGSGWSGPSVAAVALVGRGSLAWLFRLGFSQGQTVRQLGSVRVQAVEAVNALAMRTALTRKAHARVWLGGGLIYISMQGLNAAANVDRSSVSGFGAILSSGVGFDWMAWKRLSLELALAGGYVFGTARGQVRDEESVNGAGPWVGLTFAVGVPL